MLRNFLHILKRFKLASALNILGLSLAFAAFIIIAIQVRWELGFDKSFANSERIFRLNNYQVGETEGMSYTCSALYLGLKDQSSQVELSALVQPAWMSYTITVIKENGARTTFVEEGNRATTDFPTIFDFQFIDGTNTLAEPNNIIIPREIALKFFGTPYAAGKNVTIGSTQYTIGGVYEDIPSNSQIKNIIYTHFPERLLTNGNWNQWNYFMYVLLRDVGSLESTVKDFNAPDFRDRNKNRYDRLNLVPLDDIYFFEESFFADDVYFKKGSLATFRVIIAIAILIVLIAVINFINFSTSLAPVRIKSVNTQKVMGCETSKLRLSLVGEALGLSILAFGVALLWVYMISDSSLRSIIEAGVSMSGNWGLIFCVFGMVVVVGIVAGLYPAYYITKFPPALTLKGSFGLSPKGRVLRSILLAVQFTTSIALIIAAIFLAKQNSYMRTLDTGVKRDYIATTEIGGELLKQKELLATMLRESPMIEDVAFSSENFGVSNDMQGWANDINSVEYSYGVIPVSWNFAQLMGIELIDGRYTNRQDELQSEYLHNYLFNERAMKMFGIDLTYSFGEDMRIVGVMRDFNIRTLQFPIEPFAFVVEAEFEYKTTMPFVFVSYSGDGDKVVEAIKQAADKIDPTYPVEVQLPDQRFELAYRQEQQTASLISWASLLSVVISLMGIFGIVSFEVQFRRKEIAVRKVFGSTTAQVLVRLNSKFLVILSVCSLLGGVFAYFGVRAWLGGFSYRTELSWWVFVAGVAIVWLITLGVVTLQSWSRANENPSKNLKSE